ncbi:substrate-binding domain-containing protein [Alphaproteobacteria bacterium]|nr:substrate-binding domain-containing protein [Alphaproteobacteria bacterium]
MRKSVIISSVLAGMMLAGAAQARDYISIAGSSTVLPFATIVAERLGRNPDFKTPVVESGGSSVGKKGVCDGVGTEFTDIGNASSRMKEKELAYCETNGVKLTEIKVGYDGIVVAGSKAGALLKISKADLGKALTAMVPAKEVRNDNIDVMIPNPFTKWSEINPELPDIAIRVYGPPTTSGTRASFAEMVNEKGYCDKDAEAKRVLALIGQKPKNCRAMRTDGAYVEAGEQDNLIVQKLQEDPTSYGIFGFSYLDQNSDTLQGAVISGTAPTFENIASDNYSVSRALYFYVKHQHMGVIPGIAEYMTEWTKHWDEDGILAETGMIPMPSAERASYAAAMKDLPLLTADMLK